MTRAAVAQTESRNGDAGRILGRMILEQLEGDNPHALVVFASPGNDFAELLEALNATCEPGVLIGCSSAGEFTDESAGTGQTCVLALHAPEMRFAASVGRGLRQDRAGAARDLAAGFQGVDSHEFRHRAALILVDALAGYTDDLLEELTVLSAGSYQFFGGGAGDDANFRNTHVFYGTESMEDAVVALEILSNKPIGVGVRHGWTPASAALRVTESDGSTVRSLNAAPAVEAFGDHAAASGQSFNLQDPVPFFLHNVLGVSTPAGHKLRVPLGIDEAGCVMCASDLPTGATAHIMTTAATSAADAAAEAARDAVAQLGDHRPAAAFFFDCVATRLRLGAEFGLELDSMAAELGSARFAGFNTYGQIARTEGQFSGFHNCTAVVCVLPE
ncbi:FIST N-terminal domain-containing protein [soil metagenome]